MADLDATALAFAQLDAPLVAGVDYLMVDDELPETFDPTSETAVLLKVRPSLTNYNGQTAIVSVQARCYAPASVEAWDTYELLKNATHEKSGAGVKWSDIDQTGQLLRETDTGRHFVLAFFNMHMEI